MLLFPRELSTCMVDNSLTDKKLIFLEILSNLATSHALRMQIHMGGGTKALFKVSVQILFAF